MIKLLVLIEPNEPTGMAKSLLDFCQRVRLVQFDGPGIETSFVTFHRAPAINSTQSQQAAPNRFVRAARQAGFQVDVIHERFRYDPRAISELRCVIKKRAPHIVHTCHIKSHFLLRLSGMHRRQPWAAFHHGYTTTDLKMRVYNQLDRWSLRAADRIVTVCHAFARELQQIGIASERISVLHNAISPDYGQNIQAEERQALRDSLGLAEDERMILSIGRLSHEKGHADLIRAFAHLRNSHPEIKARLVIAGKGREQKRLHHLATTLGVNGQVTLIGQIDNVPVHYAAADLFVLPSLSEGSPNALLEAMAVGLPIVATAVGGIPEMVSHEKQALLTSSRKPQAMAEAIFRLLTNQSLARELAANARLAVRTHHLPEAYDHALAEIYHQMIQMSTHSEIKAPSQAQMAS
ncbi:MAG TPA: glycosyltransferase family 4 protein [Blastocatellia bacterium]|nr:glycosyltransferase family 4 protein [Blastocatellia bacterium]